jgi:hypothetical protein
MRPSKRNGGSHKGTLEKHIWRDGLQGLSGQDFKEMYFGPGHYNTTAPCDVFQKGPSLKFSE